jgi:hypothetical protein
MHEDCVDSIVIWYKPAHITLQEQPAATSSVVVCGRGIIISSSPITQHNSFVLSFPATHSSSSQDDPLEMDSAVSKLVSPDKQVDAVMIVLARPYISYQTPTVATLLVFDTTQEPFHKVISSIPSVNPEIVKLDGR